MKYAFAILVGLVFSSAIAFSAMTPELAFKKLQEGNQRFSNDSLEHPFRTEERRKQTSELQTPFAAILGCSDSRVAPEIIFDQGIGDLFIVRVAGNVAGSIELASLEYAALHLKASLIVVLGHANCGAVKAVIEGESEGIQPIADLIAPAIKDAKKKKGDLLTNAIKENVEDVVEFLEKNPDLKQKIQEGTLMIKGAYYDFHTGKVEFL